MCGIVGVYKDEAGFMPDRARLAAMNDSQAHRGPDASGLHIEPRVGLGHRRLSIIDLASGQQPLFNEDGSVVVVFNGEIYNYRDLIPELEAAGHRFRTRSDTEVIVHAWEQWGEACVLRLRGMFAFAIWDRSRAKLFLARDRLGVKPLYYAHTQDGCLIFASELKALIQWGDLALQLDPFAVEDYFAYGYIPEPRSIYQDVHKLPAGHTLLIEGGHGRSKATAAPRQYWDLQFEPGSQPDSKLRGTALETALIDRFREAVDIRMVSEVPIGAFLSGGVDSSAVVAMMAGLSEQAVNSCTIGFDQARYDETDFAAMVAERYHARQFVDVVETTGFDQIEQIVRLYDEPFADSSALPTWKVCGLARQHVTVALSGDGGDEDFAGYHRYRWHMQQQALRARVPAPLRPLLAAIGRGYPRMSWAPRFLRARSTLLAASDDPVRAYFRLNAFLDDDERQAIFSRSQCQAIDGYRAIDVLRRHAQNASGDDPLSLVQYLDYKTYLVDDILTKVDRASMAHGLEVREPVIDHKLVEFAAALPSNLKLRGDEGKYLFKKALRPYLPDEVLYRRKQGFAVPVAEWFRGHLGERMEQVINGERLLDSGLFQRPALRRLLALHRSKRRDLSPFLWALLVFDAFLAKA